MNQFEQEVMASMSNVDLDELAFLKAAMQNIEEGERRDFISVYRSKRKDPNIILLCTLLGFVGAAGVQRFIVGQIGMGILYILTAGLCFIGTIIDLINYKKLTLEYNERMAAETISMLRMMGS